jgi:hypothetical protein
VIFFTLSGDNCHGVQSVIVNIVHETLGLSFRTPLMVRVSRAMKTMMAITEKKNNIQTLNKVK